MRVERIRQLIWGIDIVIAIAALFCLWAFFLDPSSKKDYDRPEDWKGRPQSRQPIGRQTQPWTAFARVLAFAKDGERPIVAIAPDETAEAPLEQGAVARLASLNSYTRFIPKTDEARITIQLTGQTDLVTIRIGEKIPRSVWILVDVVEGQAEFQHEQEPEKKGTLELVVQETVTESGRVVGGAVDPGGAPLPPAPDTVRPGWDAVEIDPGRWQLGKREANWLGEEANVERVRRSIDAKPWKNPETGNYEGLMIRKVTRNSYVSERGGKAGDILISINGVRVIGREDVVNYVRGRGKKEKQYTLKILRNGQEMSLVYNRPK